MKKKLDETLDNYTPSDIEGIDEQLKSFVDYIDESLNDFVRDLLNKKLNHIKGKSDGSDEPS